jgi:hypothetical protein
VKGEERKRRGARADKSNRAKAVSTMIYIYEKGERFDFLALHFFAFAS